MKIYISIAIIINFTSCATNYPMTSFYVKNTSDKTINFTASIVKYTSFGPFEMTLPFTVLPKDSILARRTGFKKNASPADWFTKFIIFPVDSVALNDPKNPDNWIRLTDAKGKPIFIFNIAK